MTGRLKKTAGVWEDNKEWVEEKKQKWLQEQERKRRKECVDGDIRYEDDRGTDPWPVLLD